MLVQTAWGAGRRIALNEDCGSTTWDFVKSYCQERYIEQWILITKNYVQSVYFSFFLHSRVQGGRASKIE